MNDLLSIQHLPQAAAAAIEGGKKIMEVYNAPSFTVDYKKDHSPLTEADHASHHALVEHLETTGIPLLSEEGTEVNYETRRHWKTLWIADPLDGTKEFVKRNGEFTVNIALVENNYPTMGIIYVPVLRELYMAVKDKGVWKLSLKQQDLETPVSSLLPQAVLLKPVNPDPHTCRILVSRSHMGEEIQHFISEKEKKFNKVELLSRGSALKFCMIADGQADCYPRYRPCMEWDTAAGQVMVEEMGKKLIDLKTGRPMSYNRTNLRNSWFVVE